MMKRRLLHLLASVLVAMVISAAVPASANIVHCGYCVCERTSITCDFDVAKAQVVDNIQLDKFVPTEASLRARGLDPLTFEDLYVNCKNSRVLLNQRLTRDLLEPFANIRKVAIVRCDLTAIDPDAMQRLYRLEEFDASDNNLSLLPPRLFGHRKMTVVKLSENRKLQLDSQAFFGLTLQRLILSRCELAAFPLGALFPIEGLLELTLSENRIQFVPSKAAAVISKLSVLYLDGNPLSCTCSNKWLQESLNWTLLSPEVMRKSKLPTCKTPFNLMDIELPKVDAVEFRCSPPVINGVELHLSQDTALLQCAAAATEDPPQISSEPRQQRQGQLSWSYQHLPGGPVLSAGLDSGLRRFAKTFRRTPGLATDRFAIFLSSAGDGQTSSLNVTIEWPQLPSPTSLPLLTAPALHPTRLQPPQSAGIPEDTGLLQQQHQQQQKLPELRNNQPDDYYAAKQFTLVEMIIAVIGTFLATSLLFLLSCQFVRWYTRRDRKRWLPATAASAYGQQHAYSAGALVYGYSPHHQQHHQQLHRQTAGTAGSLSQHEYDVPRIDQPCLPARPPLSGSDIGVGGSSEFLDFSNPRLKYNV